VEQFADPDICWKDLKTPEAVNDRLLRLIFPPTDLFVFHFVQPKVTRESGKLTPPDGMGGII